MAFLRQLKYRWMYPGLSLDATANVTVAGKLQYGHGSVAGEGCNLLVPAAASLTIGAGCYFGRYVELGPGGAISVGDCTSIQDRSILVGDVSLGRYCVLSLNVLLTSGRHYFDRWPHILIRDQDVRVASDPKLNLVHSQPICVEEDCWLGMNSVIMPGVTIGRGCVVGSNAVVTHDLPPYSVAVGAPARIVRRRLEFSPPSSLNWSDLEHLPYFYRGFELADEERERNQSMGGHVARRGFALWPAGISESTVVIRICATGSGGSSLAYQGRTIGVAEQWEELRVPRGDAKAEMTFLLEGSPIVISQARTE
jgi:acetyltransferase-like isoleucine patch superfamily enzyme